MLLVAGPLPADAIAVRAAGTLALTGPYTQDFDDLSNDAGSTANTVSIAGWELSESGEGERDNEQYAVDTGESTTSDTYSYGAADSTDRALGGLSDETLIPTIGASFTNATGASIASIDVAYTGELWHLGAPDRADRLDFQISTTATSLTTGEWTDVDALDFAAPSTESSAGPRDGNDAANRSSVTASIEGLSIPDGATFWIRWATVDAAGPDDGLAVDDLVLMPHVDAAPAVAATDPADGATGITADGSVVVTFDEPVNVAGGWFTIRCSTSGDHPAAVSGGPTRFVLDPATDFAAGEGCTVTVFAAGVTDQDGGDPPDTPAADHVSSFTTQPPDPAAPPVAGDDTVSTDEDSPIDVRVTANDTDADGDLVPGTVRVVVPPAGGDATVRAGGTIRYRPDPDFQGEDEFEYEVCDTGGRCDQATVTVSVAEDGDRPVAGDDTASTDEDSPIGIRVTANDTDADGDLVPGTVRVVAPPAAGNTVVGSGGMVRYRPAPDFQGEDEFEYEVCDAGGRCDRASVTVSVAAVGDRPVAGDDTVSTDEDSPIGIRVTANDVDPDGDLDVASLVVVRHPMHGRAVVVGSAIRYRPDPEFHGRDQLEYRVCDASGRCDRATVTVSVAAVEDRPVADDVAASTDEDRPVTIDVTRNVVDPDGDLDVDSLVVVRAPAHGRAVVVDGAITFRPDADFHGRDSFAYRVCDAGGRCDRATVTVSVAAVGDRPAAGDDTASTAEDTPIDIRVTANDTDADGDLQPVAVRIVAPPRAGNATVAADGTIRYRPDLNFHGRDRFEYRVCDSSGRCDRARVTVSVAPVRDRPVANDDTASTDEDTAIGIRVTANDTDVDGDLDVDSVVVVRKPAHGRAVVVGGSIRYRPDPNFHGQDRFDYRVCDSRSACVRASVTVAIQPVNDTPVAVSDVVIVAGPGEASVDVLDNDWDVDGRTDLDPASVTIVAGPSLGTATVNVTTGAIEYTVSLGTDGTDRLTYRVCDRSGACSTAELEIRIDLPTSPSGTLPPTGSGFGGVAGTAALVAVGVGAFLFVASRRTSLVGRRSA
jgi:hypothetical protein